MPDVYVFIYVYGRVVKVISVLLNGECAAGHLQHRTGLTVYIYIQSQGYSIAG